MIARRLSLAVLAVAAFLACIGCQPAVQPAVQNQKGPRPAQKKASPKWMRSKSKLDDDSIRVRLLVVETVQENLGLNADQIQKIRDYVKISGERYREFLAKLRELFPPSRSFPQEEFDAREQEFRAFSEDVKRKGKELQTKILAMLTPSQSERLKQIQLQAAIPTALARPEIIKALDISEEQRGKIRALCDRMEKKQVAEWPSFHGLDPKERRQKMIEFMKEWDKVQAEATKPILDILTPQQRAKFEKLQGKRIDVTRPYDALIPEDAEF